MAPSSSTDQSETKKKGGFFSFGKKNKPSKPKRDPNKQQKVNAGDISQAALTRGSSAASEHEDRLKYDDQDYSTADRESKRSLIALAYETTTTQSFRDSHQVSKKKPEVSKIVSYKTAPVPVILEERGPRTKANTSGGWFTRSSFFRNICNDAFDQIDADRSGKINESELYQGLLLIHLKLGMYFGPAACKPISMERTKHIFHKLDVNKDGSLDKDEFQKVLALLIGNVVLRILFQFVCTLMIIPLFAATVLDKLLDVHGFVHGIVVISWLPVFREKYQPLLEMAFCWDLIKEIASSIAAWLFVRLDLEGPAQVFAEKLEEFVLQPISEVPEETWDSLPLTVISSVLTMIIVPFAIVKTDDFFRYLANLLGVKE